MKFNYFIENAGDEADALYELEQQGFKWGVGENPTSLIISRIMGECVFPYNISIGKDKKIYWSSEDNEGTGEMNKYKITQALMQDLKVWQDERHIYAENNQTVSWEDFKVLPTRIREWQLNTGSAFEANNRFIAIIKWLNGEDIFEIDKKRQFGVRSVERNDNHAWFKANYCENGTIIPSYDNDLSYATLFDTSDQAAFWTTSGYKVVEVDE